MLKLPLKHKDTSPRGITQFLRYLLNLKDIQRGKNRKCKFLINYNFEVPHVCIRVKLSVGNSGK